MASITSHNFHLCGTEVPAIISLSGSEAPVIHVEFLSELLVNNIPLKHLRYIGFNGYKSMVDSVHSDVKTFIEIIGKDIEHNFKHPKPVRFLSFLFNNKYEGIEN